MTLLFVDEGKEKIWDSAIKQIEDMELILFTNDHVPVVGDDASDYTEPVGGGYALKTLTKASWVIGTAAGVTSASYAQQTFNFTADVGDIYGYAVIGAISGLLYGAERFVSEEPTYNGQTMLITPVLNNENQ